MIEEGKIATEHDIDHESGLNESGRAQNRSGEKSRSGKQDHGTGVELDHHVEIDGATEDGFGQKVKDKGKGTGNGLRFKMIPQTGLVGPAGRSPQFDQSGSHGNSKTQPAEQPENNLGRWRLMRGEERQMESPIFNARQFAQK